MANTSKKTTTTTKKEEKLDSKVLDELKNENKELKQQLQELMSMVKTTNTPIQTVINTTGMERDIPVMSLLPYELNLSTEPFGQGNIYTFKEMYEIMDIPFGDLKAIVRSNKKMTQNGRFYILDEEAVATLRLKGVYKNIINPETLQGVLNNLHNGNELVQIYKTAPKGQQQMIVSLLQDKRLHNENIDMNTLYEIEKLAGVNLVNTDNMPELDESQTTK